MSVKHIEQEYDRVCNDYKDMIESLHDLEDLVSQNIVSQEKVDNIKESLETIKNNYMRWSWVMHLLNLPNRKNKQKKYNKQFSKRIELNNSIKSEHIENIDALNSFKDKVKNF